MAAFACGVGDVSTQSAAMGCYQVVGMATAIIDLRTRPPGGGIARKSMKVNSTNLHVNGPGGRWRHVGKGGAHPAPSMESSGCTDTVPALINAWIRPQEAPIAPSGLGLC